LTQFSIDYSEQLLVTIEIKSQKTELIQRCTRATPKEWIKYLTASRVVKIIRDEHPCYLYCKLVSNYYEEPRKPKSGMFFDRSWSKTGHQSLFFKFYLRKETYALSELRQRAAPAEG